jgi:hypothetical protein
MSAMLVGTQARVGDHRAGNEQARRHGGTSLDEGAHSGGSSSGYELSEPLAEWVPFASSVCGPFDQRERRQCRGGVAQRRARAIHTAAHRAVAEPHQGCHMLVTMAVDGRADQRFALKWG